MHGGGGTLLKIELCQLRKHARSKVNFMLYHSPSDCLNNMMKMTG
jgi:hypothetical protein